MTTRQLTPWAAVATTVRNALRVALKVNPAGYHLPPTVTVKVTSDSFAGGAAVNVELSDADEWAWRTATGADASPYVDPGDRMLTAEARAAGDAIAEVIEAARDAHGEAGYVWGAVTYFGTTIGSLAREGFVPGQD